METPVLANEVNRNDAQRHKRIKLVVVARDNLTGNLLGQHDTKAIGQGDAASRFELTDAPNKLLIYVTPFDYSRRLKVLQCLSCYRLVMFADEIIINLKEIHRVSVALVYGGIKKTVYLGSPWLAAKIGNHRASV